MGYDARLLKAVNELAVDFCRDLQPLFAGAGVDTRISGAIGPRRDAWQHDAAMTIREAYEYHAPQIETFAGTAADFVTAYTLTNRAEAVGIALAAQRLGMPCVLSFTLETDGRLPGGDALGDIIAEVDALTGSYPAYYMINCAHPRHFMPVLEQGGAFVERIGGIRANASVRSHAELDNSDILDRGDPADLAHRYRDLLPLLPNLKVLGGCCGTDHQHIEAVVGLCFADHHHHHGHFHAAA